jgi:CopG family transcriptional regulator, nickel-responsive regulator
MSDLVRFGVAMERALLERFDERIARRGYENRSEALRDLVRRELIRDDWEQGGDALATITLVFDSSIRDIHERLFTIVNEASGIVSTLRVNISHNRTMEVIVARGTASGLRLLADKLLGQRGVLTGDIVAGLVEPQTGTS